MPKKRSFFFFLLICIGWFACKKVDIQFGDQFLDNGYTQIVTVDSFPVALSTIYVDSFITSAQGVTVVGAYSDPVFGKIKSNNFFEVVPPGYAQATSYIDSFTATTFDSIALIIKPDGSYIGDTTKPFHIDVSKLAQSIVPYDNSLLNLYNNDSFAVIPQTIGSKDFYLRPTSGDSIVVRLSDDLGKTLLKKFQDPNDGDVRSNDAFLQYLYGMRLSAGANSQLIFGSKDTVAMRLYYKKPGLYLESLTMDFLLANKSHHFNNISVDRSATVLKNLSSVNNEISSTVTGNTSYTMYAAGAMAKVRFPSVRDILKVPNYAKILKATLLIRPVRGTYGTGSYVLPPQIRLSSTTQLNQIGSDLSFISSNGASQVQTGNLQVDLLYGESTNYAYDVTSYIKSLILDGSINLNGFLIIPPSPALVTQFGRLVIGNRDNLNGQMQLVILYATVQ
jgi:hypothetical protein